MKRISFSLCLFGLVCLQAIPNVSGTCLGTTTTYKNKVSNQHTSDMNSLVSAIDTITNLVKNNIKAVEKDNNLDLYETIQNLKNGEVMSILKRNFSNKKQLELQSILNSVIGE